MARTAKEPEVIDAELGVTDEDVQALTVQPQTQMIVSRPPDVVLEEARLAARALTDVIEKKPKKVMFNGHIYLEFEDWQTVAKFYGATVKVTETKYVEFGEVKGFEAKAVVLNVNTGMEISGAEAMCLNDEPNWKKKPLFQLKSMAQTRASAKALRNVFAWVVVLAGYKPTPAEEMDGVRERKESQSAEAEMVAGIVERPTMSSGSLFFYIGKEIFCIPPMVGKNMKEQLEQAEKAFVELMALPTQTTTGGKEYRKVIEILKYEPNVPF